MDLHKELSGQDDSGDGQSLAQLTKTTKIFRIFRVLRVFRLVKLNRCAPPAPRSQPPTGDRVRRRGGLTRPVVLTASQALCDP